LTGFFRKEKPWRERAGKTYFYRERHLGAPKNPANSGMMPLLVAFFGLETLLLEPPGDLPEAVPPGAEVLDEPDDLLFFPLVESFPSTRWKP